MKALSSRVVIKFVWVATFSLILTTESACAFVITGSRRFIKSRDDQVDNRRITPWRLNVKTESTALFVDLNVPTPHLSVILPAYNEADRIGETIESYRSYLSGCSMFSQGKDNCCEILVVDDGSTDETVRVVENLATVSTNGTDRDRVPIRCISLPQNEGKGAAISYGIADIDQLCSSLNRVNSIILVADADGSGDIRCLPGLVIALRSELARHKNSSSSLFWAQPGVVVGNRGYEGTSLARSILRWGFRTAVRLICGDLRVQDSQCGFKLMSLSAGVNLYSSRLHLRRWTHDVEVLYLARELGVPVSEYSVGWEDKDGSKLVTSAGSAGIASAAMLSEILGMRFNYAIGRWSVDKEQQPR